MRINGETALKRSSRAIDRAVTFDRLMIESTLHRFLSF
jgi:hypothetical protein